MVGLRRVRWWQIVYQHAVAEYEHHDEEQLVVSHELQDEEIKVGYDASPLQAEYDAVVDENVALKAYLDYIVAEYSKVLEEFDVELARHAIIQECLDTVLEGKERTSLLFELCHSAPGLHLDQHEVGKEWSELADWKDYWGAVGWSCFWPSIGQR